MDFVYYAPVGDARGILFCIFLYIINAEFTKSVIITILLSFLHRYDSVIIVYYTWVGVTKVLQICMIFKKNKNFFFFLILPPDALSLSLSLPVCLPFDEIL